jgi:hypothetical protein
MKVMAATNIVLAIVEKTEHADPLIGITIFGLG